MVRADVDARYKTFDIKTVANKFDLNGAGDYCVPLIVDMEARKIVLVDLYMSGRAFYNNVEGSYGNVALACRELAQFTETRPTMDTLARVHAEGRGAALTSERADADITFGTRDGTYRASDVEGVLATLL